MRAYTTPIAIFFVLLCASRARAAEPRELWVYYPTNLLVDENIDHLKEIWTRAAKAGYSHVLLSDSKFARLGDLDKHYFANLERTRKIAADLKLQIVPAVFPVGYSNDMLWHDPNLAEGLPVKDALFIVHGGVAALSPDPAIAFRAKFDWMDESVSLAGGVATVQNNPANARLEQKLTVSRFRCYHVSVKIKTDDYTGTPEIKAIADNRDLNYKYLGVKKTQDWTEHHIVFNSLDHDEVNVYLGVWGGAKGTLRWKDWKIEEAGPVNILRRPGAPLTVKADGRDVTYVEGKDFDKLVDPHLGTTPWAGEYDVWHEPPVLKTHLPEGTRLRVSWYHPVVVYDEQVSMCLTEPKTMDLLADQAKRMKAAFAAPGYMMSHDELRVLGWDDACEKAHASPGKILADNARACTKLLQGELGANSPAVYVWSDMFDPFHNAVKTYYLVHGDLTNSWDGLDKSVIIMNWNFEKRDDSLKFFAGRGHRQILAGYYDGDPQQIKEWIVSANKVKGVEGIMYTTWKSDYSQLEAFAKACGE